jgi:hypothetical protein
MKLDWTKTVERLNRYPTKTHRFLPPCPKERVATVQTELGKLPEVLVEMLVHFNGARLFKKTVPFVSIFGISTIPAMPPLEWAKDWYIDKFTPAWRLRESGRQNQWAIAMMNHGGLIILEGPDKITQWDMAQKKWESKAWKFDEWVENLLTEGDLYLQEQ